MSIDKKIILVIGATGVQGTHVVNALLAPCEDGTPTPYTVRALTRDLTSKSAQNLSQRSGVECVKGMKPNLRIVICVHRMAIRRFGGGFPCSLEII